METISREELKEKLDQGDDFKLVMVMSEFAYRTMHIPGSLNIYTEEQGAELLDSSDEIVVYCSNEHCMSSQIAYSILKEWGYENVRRYSGGIVEWEEAGYPLAGKKGNISNKPA